ncbi:MAG: GH116 family glycosyl-hydrolase [Armatimonadetes bacterium]|nr:GH116 family glycosyl-hydrolase [Armatimonadota bacterium]
MVKAHFSRCDNPLSQLQFKNFGAVKNSMQFEYLSRPCYYMEDVDVWSTPWSNANYRYLYEVRDGKPITPPNGMRSAVPLGGLGAGTIELRADGSLKEWNIFNNSPAGGGQKVHLDDALFGLRTSIKGSKTNAWTLRTHPPKGLPSIAQIEYSGAFPVSRLRFADPNLPIALDLYAYCGFKIYDPESSATPAILFTFNLHNPSDQIVETSLMFNLPNHIGGVYSKRERGLVLSKQGSEPTSGAMGIWVDDENALISSSIGQDIIPLWDEFEESGSFKSLMSKDVHAKHGALAVSFKLEPMQSKTLTFVLAWYFPYRPHGDEILGNYYTRLYESVEDVANKVISKLPSIWDAIYQWQTICFDNSLPDWLQDALVNSVATMFKTSMWFADGRFRQWESFSCPAVEPIHIHFYRSLPYAFFFPTLQKNILKGFAKTQSESGYIEENLGDSSGPLDQPKGRQMGDGCTVFILAVYQNYLWTGDKNFLDELWLNVKKAAQWQIERCAKFGLPNNLNNTYDWWDFEHKYIVAYNAFLHIAAMMAAEKLAIIQGDEEFANLCRANIETSRKALNELLWNGEYFRAWWEKEKPSSDASINPLHADTLYGQLWAFILGLGWTTEPEKVSSHLAMEQKKNSSPFGLKVMQGTDCDDDRHPDPRPGHAPYENGPVNNLVWQAGSLDWASLNIYIGGDVQQSLLEAEKVIQNWRENLRDQWDYRDLTTGWDGYPWCNSHYSRQLIFWAIVLALSGQQYSAPDKRLRFDPKVSALSKLPFFTPKASGTLEILGDGKFKLTVLVGELELNELQVREVSIAQPICLKTGQSFVM